MATEYPVTLNPFDSEAEEDDDDKNPFKDTDDEDEPKVSPPSLPIPKERFLKPTSPNVPSLPLEKSGSVSSVHTTDVASSRENLSYNSSHRGSVLSSSRNSDAESLPSPQTQRKFKRQAPAAPVRRSVMNDTDQKPSPDESSGGKPPVQPLTTRKKKPAPLPPRLSNYGSNSDKLDETQTKTQPSPNERDIDAAVEKMSLKSDSQTPRELYSPPSRSARNSLVPVQPEINALSDEETLDFVEQNISQSEMNKYMELWKGLKAEQKEIETELRLLMECPEESRTPEVISHEQFLMDALMENVRKRQDLAEEAEEEEDREIASTLAIRNGNQPKKMKKKKRFRLKKLLGVQT